MCAVRVRLGDKIDKTLRVVGDRTWKDGVPSDPTPFDEMPMTYARAFGGPGFARNPTGKGFPPSRDLPNVEDPRALILSPRDRPEPAGFASIDFTWPQRTSKAGTYDKKWLKDRYPGFPEDMDWTIFQAAPADQQIEGFFAGDETFSFEHMHPKKKAVLMGKLPGVRVRVFVRFKGSAELSEVTTRIDTVRLFPHLERGVLVARGLVKVAEDDAHDVEHLMLAAEAIGSEKPFAHYEGVLAARLDKKDGPLAALRDGDLTPPRDLARKKEPVPGAELAAEGRLRKRMRVRQENTRKDSRRAADEHGRGGRRQDCAGGPARARGPRRGGFGARSWPSKWSRRRRPGPTSRRRRPRPSTRRVRRSRPRGWTTTRR